MAEGCWPTWIVSTDPTSRLRSYAPRFETSTSTQRTGGWRYGPSGARCSSLVANSSPGCLGGEYSSSRCQPDPSMSPTEWTAGWRSSPDLVVSSGLRDGCAPCAQRASMSTAAATPPGCSQGPRNPVCTWHSRLKRVMSKFSCVPGCYLGRRPRAEFSNRPLRSRRRAPMSSSRIALHMAHVRRFTRRSASTSTAKESYGPTTYSACGPLQWPGPTAGQPSCPHSETAPSTAILDPQACSPTAVKGQGLTRGGPGAMLCVKSDTVCL